MKRKSPRWNKVVSKQGDTYHSYAVHTNGKVEKAGERKNLNDAILCADELTNMLNQYHRYAGKYEGKDIIVGRRVSTLKVNRILKRQSDALRNFLKKEREIFGLR